MSNLKSILIKFQYDQNDDFLTHENLWAKELDKHTYQLENSPFYAYGLSYKDIIKATFDTEEQRLVFQKVLKRNGHSTYRVFINKNLSSEKFEEYWKELKILGCTYESSGNLFSIDVPQKANINKVYEILEKGESDRILEFEEAHFGHSI